MLREKISICILANAFLNLDGRDGRIYRSNNLKASFVKIKMIELTRLHFF